MIAPLRLLETMRADRGRIALLDRHLGRLATSAARLGYPVDPASVRARLADALDGTSGVLGVRLTLGARGDVEIVASPLTSPPFRMAALDLEPLPEAGGPLCIHKTTRRDHYRQRHERAAQRGADEAILVNDRGEVTEGTRTNVWVERDGRLWTPPLASGGLAGVMRAHVLATRPDAGEAVVAPDDLAAAEAVYLSNALRGWMRVEVVG